MTRYPMHRPTTRRAIAISKRRRIADTLAGAGFIVMNRPFPLTIVAALPVDRRPVWEDDGRDYGSGITLKYL